MVGFKPDEMQTLQETAKRFDASTAWVIRQIVIGNISPLQKKMEA
jgi:hypothetical protein